MPFIYHSNIRHCHSQIQQNVRHVVSLPSKSQMTEQSYPDFCILDQISYLDEFSSLSSTSFSTQLCFVFKYSENKLYLVRALGSNPKIFTFWILCNLWKIWSFAGGSHLLYSDIFCELTGEKSNPKASQGWKTNETRLYNTLCWFSFLCTILVCAGFFSATFLFVTMQGIEVQTRAIWLHWWNLGCSEGTQHH